MSVAVHNFMRHSKVLYQNGRNAGIVREKYKIGIADSQNCQLSEYYTFVIRSTLTKIVRYGKGRVNKVTNNPPN